MITELPVPKLETVEVSRTTVLSLLEQVEFLQKENDRLKVKLFDLQSKYGQIRIITTDGQILTS